jgi:hypothetical protein
VCSFGIFEYFEGKKIRDRNKGNWIFKVDQKGVYLATPSGIKKNIPLQDISAIEKIKFREDSDRYELVENNIENIDLSLPPPIDIDYAKVIEVLKYYGVPNKTFNYDMEWDYEADLKKKCRTHKKLNEGFEF